MFHRIKVCTLTVHTIAMLFFETSATTLWTVTENGKIEPQMDTLFEMRRPDDLLSFLSQEKHITTANRIYRSMLQRTANIDRQMTTLEAILNHGHELYSTDVNCLLTDDVDLYASIVINGSSIAKNTKQDYMVQGTFMDREEKILDCVNSFPLDYNVHTFDHLIAMQNRRNLKQHREKELMKSFPPGITLNKFGEQVAYGLLHNKTSWLYLNLASIYWRIRGNAYNALECSRRAIVSAPRQYRDIPLLTTGGILHAARHSNEAAIILHTAIDYNPTQSYTYLALGHIYVVLGEYDRATICYNNCIKLTPSMEEAKAAKQALFCKLIRKTPLTSVLENMQSVLTELDAYRNERVQWFELSTHILRNRATRISTISIEYDAVQENNGSKNDETILDDTTQGFVQVLKDVENHVKEVSDYAFKSKPFHEINSQLKLTVPPIYINLEACPVYAEPTEQPKYSSFEFDRTSFMFDNGLWPMESECNRITLSLSDGKQYIPVYLPPENKGYTTHTFMNKLIFIPQNKTHLLLSHPVCDPPQIFHEKYISTTLLTIADNYSTPDTILKFSVNELVQNGDVVELGQRILTAVKLKATAPWVMSMLASLYWRIVGKPRNALDCLQLALDTVPEKFKDVPLVSIASINHKVGLIHDAYRITKEALQINSVEPTTNYLYGMLLYLKGDWTQAIEHIKRALRMDMHMSNDRSLALLRILMCEEKFFLCPR